MGIQNALAALNFDLVCLLAGSEDEADAVREAREAAKSPFAGLGQKPMGNFSDLLAMQRR